LYGSEHKSVCPASHSFLAAYTAVNRELLAAAPGKDFLAAYTAVNFLAYLAGFFFAVAVTPTGPVWPL
ncbi:hypothetical protein CLM86_21850, partial [Pseudomonas aeruginosa]